tara:strand:+ start:1425 stop:1607 length:183 start_codon:yes stop_codon:yes gene_type:complete
MELVQADKVVEASDLGWSPGQWPKCCFLGQMVNGDIREDEILYVDYMNYETEVLTRVFND